MGRRRYEQARAGAFWTHYTLLQRPSFLFTFSAALVYSAFLFVTAADYNVFCSGWSRPISLFIVLTLFSNLCVERGKKLRRSPSRERMEKIEKSRVDSRTSS